jgi:hypothetical protein
MSKLDCVKLFADKQEADIAAGYLKANGIDSVVFIDNCGGMEPGMENGTGIRLMVNEDDKKAALELFKGM